MGGTLRGVGVFGSSAVALPFSRWVTVGISLRARDWKEIDRVKPEGGQDSASGAPQPQLCDGRQVLALKQCLGEEAGWNRDRWSRAVRKRPKTKSVSWRRRNSPFVCVLFIAFSS